MEVLNKEAVSLESGGPESPEGLEGLEDPEEENDVEEVKESFQPGATPWCKHRRYLAFCLAGYVTAIKQEEKTLIRTEFFDKSVHNYISHLIAE